MKNILLKQAFVLFFLVKVSLASNWELPVLKEMVLHNSLELSAQKHRVSAAKYEKEKSLLQFIPKMEIKLSYDDYLKISQGLTYAEPNPYNSSDYSLSLSIPLLSGFENYSAYRLVDADYKIANLQMLKIRKNLLKKLTLSYFEILKIQSNEEHQKKRVESYLQEMEISKEKLAKGENSLLNYKEAQLSKEKSLHQLVQFSQKKKKLLLQLSQLMNVEFDFWKSKDSFGAPKEIQEGSSDYTSKLPPQNSPDILIAKMKAKKAEEQIDLKAYGYFPSLNFNAKYGFHEVNQLYPNHKGLNYSYGLSMQWAINSLFLTHKSTSSMKEEWRATLNDLKQVKKNDSEEYNETVESLQFLVENLEYSKKILSLQKERLEVIEAKLELKLLSLSDRNKIWLECLNSELDVELAWLEVCEKKHMIRMMENK